MGQRLYVDFEDTALKLICIPFESSNTKIRLDYCFKGCCIKSKLYLNFRGYT